MANSKIIGTNSAIKAIFLDRDGLINNNSAHYYIYKTEDFDLNPGVIDSLKAFSKKGYLLLIITNQGGIAKNIYSIADVENLNKNIIQIFKNEDIEIKDILYCPHHSSISKCLCRKPDSLLFEKAIAKFGIDPSISFMIGDSERDVLASEKVGIRGIKVPSNANLYQEIKQSLLAPLLD